MLITYIKGGTPAQIFLERGSAMRRFDEKRAIIPIWVLGITSKLQGR
jgi:hypothetical protein